MATDAHRFQTLYMQEHNLTIDEFLDDQPWLPALLCRAPRQTIAGHGPTAVCKWLPHHLHPDLLGLPRRWRTPRRIFVNSMSDLFHEAIPEAFIQRVFAVMGLADRHCFQIFTKRAERLAALSQRLPWRPHIWMGVSVEQPRYTCRIDALRKTGAQLKFLSLEPLLGRLPNLDLRGIDWVIVGGESGPGARPMDPAWVLDLRDQCQRARIPFFFKQWVGNKLTKPVALLVAEPPLEALVVLDEVIPAA